MGYASAENSRIREIFARIPEKTGLETMRGNNSRIQKENGGKIGFWGHQPFMPCAFDTSSHP